MNEIYKCPKEVGRAVHEWESDVWGIYCKHCGQMRLVPERGEFVESDEPQKFFDGKH